MDFARGKIQVPSPCSFCLKQWLGVFPDSSFVSKGFRQKKPEKLFVDAYQHKRGNECVV
jgi:hypothetical protein